MNSFMELVSKITFMTYGLDCSALKKFVCLTWVKHTASFIFVSPIEDAVLFVGSR